MNPLRCTDCNNFYFAIGAYDIVNVSTYQICQTCHRALGNDCVCIKEGME